MVVLFNESSYYNRTIGVYRIATVLRKQGIEVEVIDFISKWNLDELLGYVDRIPNVDWYGFSTRFVPPARDLSSYITVTTARQRYGHEMGLFTYMSPDDEDRFLAHIRAKNRPLVLGGPNAGSMRALTKDFDIIAMGYSDIGVTQIHNHITRNDQLKYEIFNDMKIVNCDVDYPVNDLSDLTTLYDPSDCVIDGEVFPIEIGRGCIFRCAFCEYDHIGKKPGTYIRPAESISQDLADKYTKYGSSSFIFLDDTFNDDTDKLRMIESIKQDLGFDFEFWAYCRIDLLRAHAEQVDLIDRIGWKFMTCGIETFNKESGKRVGKGADPDKLKDFIVDLLEKYPDLRLQLNIVIGLPSDTEEKIYETVDWLVENKHLNIIARFNPLGIRSSDGNFGSLMSKNLEKYGYTAIRVEPRPRGTIFWQSNTMNLDDAKRIHREATKKYVDGTRVYEKGKKMHSTYFEEAGVWKNLKTNNLWEEYILRKKQYQARNPYNP